MSSNQQKPLEVTELNQEVVFHITPRRKNVTCHFSHVGFLQGLNQQHMLINELYSCWQVDFISCYVFNGQI